MKITPSPETLDEQQLRTLFQEAYPAAEPTDALRQRIARGEVKDRVPVPSPFARQFRVAAVSGLLVAGVLVARELSLPHAVSAEPLKRALQAVEKVRFVHLSALRYAEDGTPTERFESWFNADATTGRQESYQLDASGNATLTEASVIANGRGWHYEPARNRVTVRQRRSLYSNVPSGYTLSDMRRDLTRYGNRAFHDRGVSMWNGRLVQTVEVESHESNIDIRLIFRIDPKTSLPLQMETLLEKEGRSTRDMVQNFAFNEAAPPGLFTPNFPATATMVDLDAEQKRWAEHLSHRIAEKTLPDGRRIVIRDLIVNREGDVFLLYTAGKRMGDSFDAGLIWPGRDWQVRITDNLGNEYLPHSRRYFAPPSMPNGERPEDLLGFEQDGERLENDSWSPRRPQTQPWQSRRFTITFETAALNRHGDTKTRFPADFSVKTSFTLTVQRTILPLLPEEAQFSSPHNDEQAFLTARAEARGELPPGIKPSPELIGEMPRHTDRVMSLAFSPDGRTLASSGWKDTLRFSDPATGAPVPGGKINAPWVIGGGYSPDGRTLLTLSDSFNGRRYSHSVLTLRDARTGQERWTVTLPRGKDNPMDCGFSADGGTIFVIGFRSEETQKDQAGEEFVRRMSSWVQWRDARTGAVQKTVRVPHGSFRSGWDSAHHRLVTSASTLEKGHFVSASYKLWNAETGKLERELSAPEGMDLSCFQFTPDGRRVIGAGIYHGNAKNEGDRNGMVIWDVATGTVEHAVPFQGDFPMVNALTISPDGRYAAVASGKIIYLYEIASGREVTHLVGHGQEVMQAAFSPDGRHLATGDLTGRILLWQVL